MSLEKINVTLYDLLGYVLPGFLILLGVSILEATFAHSHIFYIARLVKNPVVATILAYFLGQIAHVTASWLKDRYRKRFTDYAFRLSVPLRKRVKEELRTFYDLPEDVLGAAKLTTLETYQLSEAYLSVTGGHLDRDVYLAREGFAKSTMVALTFFGLALLACLIPGGAVVQTQPESASLIRVTWYGTLGMALAAWAAAAVFRRQFLFFSRLKNNSAMLAFLAHRQKEEKLAQMSKEAVKTP